MKKKPKTPLKSKKNNVIIFTFIHLDEKKVHLVTIG